MYAVIFKQDKDTYVILDAYYKGRWESDKSSLIVYLNYIALNDKFGKDKQNSIQNLIARCRKYNIEEDQVIELEQFFKDEKLPIFGNFDSDYIISKLDSFDKGFITPPTPIIEVTPFCNYKCPWCYIPPRDISRKEFYNEEELLNNVIEPLITKYGLLEWCLTGGEPTIDAEHTAHIARLITEISVKILKRKPVSIYLLTNGYDLEANVALFKEAGINAYQVALTSPNPETENVLRNPPKGVDSYERAVNGLKAVVSRGMRAEINMIIQPLKAHKANNLYDIPGMVELARETGIRMLRIIPAVPCGQAKENNIWMTKVEYDEVRRMVREGRKRIPEIVVDCPIDQKIEADRDIYCRAGTLWIYIDFKGNIFPCNNMQNQDCKCWDDTIKNVDIVQIWEKSKLLNYMRDYTAKTICNECIACDVRVECVGECRAMAWARYKKLDLAEKPEVCFRDLNMEVSRGY